MVATHHKASYGILRNSSRLGPSALSQEDLEESACNGLCFTVLITFNMETLVLKPLKFPIQKIDATKIKRDDFPQIHKPVTNNETKSTW